MSQKPKIVILTGAGISAESGIQTFRDNGGLWETHKIEDVATPEAFAKNPDLVWKFYNQRRKALLSEKVAPNPAHFALAELEHRLGDQVLIVTQNIDNLHERAGNFNVLHMHGSLLEARCTKSERCFPWMIDMDANSICNCCGEKGLLRPNIVWFGEMPFDLSRIFQELETCTLFMSIGTSGQVYPAGGFVQHINMKTKAHAVELNLESSLISDSFHEKIYGPASEVVPAYIKSYLNSSHPLV